MHQRIRLLRDRAREAAVRVAERRDADAREQVEVFAPLGVEQAYSLATHERDRLAAIRLQHMARFAPDDVVHHRRHHTHHLLAGADPA